MNFVHDFNIEMYQEYGSKSLEKNIHRQTEELRRKYIRHGFKSMLPGQ
jgi:hypothetical protein